MAKKTKKAKRVIDPLDGKRDVVSNLYRSVLRYVQKNGGNLVLAGGINIYTWPGSKPGQFEVAVKCLGTLPTLPRGSRIVSE